MAALDTILKVTLIASALSASASVGYYYLHYLPQRDAKIEADQKLERARAKMEEEEKARLAAEERAAVRQAEEERQQAEEERKSAEKAAVQLRYQRCLSDAREDYNASWAAQCKKVAAKFNDSKRYADCIAAGIAKLTCDSNWKPDPSPNCSLPRTIGSDVQDQYDKAQSRCLQESSLGLQ